MSTVSGVLVTMVALAMHADLTSPGPFDFAILFTLAVFPGTLGHVLTNWAHAHTTAFSISMMLLAGAGGLDDGRSGRARRDPHAPPNARRSDRAGVDRRGRCHRRGDVGRIRGRRARREATAETDAP
jgi:hypothetical protein